jgi:ABC-type transport system substrate-binding protein
MKRKIIISLSLIFTIALMMSCTKQPYYDIPYDENGNVYITEISVITADPVTTADANFTINCYFPNAKSGDTMKATVLKQQVPSWDPEGATQLLPLAGSEKSITVGGDFKTTVTYTLAEAGLVNAGDAITVVFSGATDSGKISITLQAAN